MPSFHITTANTIPEAQLLQFFHDAYAPRMDKVERLQKHHSWMYRGSAHHFLALETTTGEIAGQSVGIPMRMALAPEIVDITWWSDLIVLPEYRRQGVQGMLNATITGLQDLTMAASRREAAKLLRKVGYRDAEIGQHNRLILNYMHTKRPYMTGWLAPAVWLSAVFQQVAKVGFRSKVARYTPKIAYALQTPTASELAAIFTRGYSGTYLTKYRDADYIQWRFLDDPTVETYHYFAAGDPPTLGLILGIDAQNAYIADLFGAIEDPLLVNDLLGLAIRYAHEHGAAEVLFLATHPALGDYASAWHFTPDWPRRINWYSKTPAQMALIAQLPHHWSLTDTDI